MTTTTATRTEGPDGLRTEEWYRTATRWTQVTFVEDDPGAVDLGRWTEIMRRTQSNAACISAGGYMAFYPTDIPFHYVSRHLGGDDLFGRFVDAARGLDMHVMARVDPHAVHADAAEAHPEWLALDADGDPIEHPSMPGTWITCPFGPYNPGFITEVACEIVSRYDVDAVFANRWQGTGMSYSSAAREAFAEDTGMQLPTGEFRADDPAWAAYGPWRRSRLTRLVARWDDAVRAVRPHARFIPNLGSFASHELERDLVQRHYPLFFIDKQARSRLEPPWVAGRNGKRSRSIFRDRPVGLITSVGPETGHRWKDSVNSAAETELWIADGFAQGAFPWFTKFNGKLADERWIEPVVKGFGLHASAEPVLSRMTVQADVALLDPVTVPETGAAGRDDRDGLYHALVEARIPFELVSDRNCTPEELARFRVLVVGDVPVLADDVLAAIEAFARAGGSVVATHRAGLLTSTGTPTDALSVVLGIRRGVQERGPLLNNAVALTGSSDLHAPFGGTQRIVGGTRLTTVEAVEAGVETPFRFVPDFPDLPMEEVYPREQVGPPAVTLWRRPDGGRSAYLAFDIGSLFWEALLQDHAELLAAAVRWALGEQPQVRVHGPGLVDLALWQGGSEQAVCLVNLSNPMAMRGSYREHLPLGALEVDVPVPAGHRLGTVSAVLGDPVLQVRQEGERVRVLLAPLELMEIVHLTWEAR